MTKLEIISEILSDAFNSKKATKEKVIEYDINGHVDYRYQQFRLKMLMDY
ncbi:hypothetical protein EZS27_010964 [termite gut metagenome]|uniref:Uncharacterized protein n=1 Tax=termite gut metagenome TaxID=433724 RepID=A0A5J4S565_9ZZZZ